MRLSWLPMSHALARVGDLYTAVVRVCVSGGAPLCERTATCFASRGVPLVEGYGLAEAGPVVALSNPRINRPGAVGLPLPGVAVRLDDRPESRGQLLVRTPCRAVAVIKPTGDHGRETRCDADAWPIGSSWSAATPLRSATW